jgi:hypothetical protein
MESSLRWLANYASFDAFIEHSLQKVKCKLAHQSALRRHLVHSVSREGKSIATSCLTGPHRPWPGLLRTCFCDIAYNFPSPRHVFCEFVQSLKASVSIVWLPPCWGHHIEVFFPQFVCESMLAHHMVRFEGSSFCLICCRTTLTVLRTIPTVHSLEHLPSYLGSHVDRTLLFRWRGLNQRQVEMACQYVR